jgi:hypothetical protein
MEVLKVKIDFEKPSSGSIPESPKIYLTRCYLILDSKICKKKHINNLLKKAIYKTRYKRFRSGIIYVQNWRVCELLKCILAIFCFNNKVSNLYNDSVVAKIYGMSYIFTLLMFRKAKKTTINKIKTTIFYRSTFLRFSLIFRYFKVFQVKRIVYIYD